MKREYRKQADAAGAAVLSGLGCIFALKEKQRTAPKAFLCEKVVFTLLPFSFIMFT